jgi:hypothetical protein
LYDRKRNATACGSWATSDPARLDGGRGRAARRRRVATSGSRLNGGFE